jgi:general secretion pathway protein A
VYTSYFGFKENPFSLTPDPTYLYLSRHHKEAFDHLLYGIKERKGFIVITGGIGTGKTTLCRALLGTLDSSTKTALIFNAYTSDMELLRTINQEFGIDGDVPDPGKKDHVDSLNKFLLETFSHDGNAVILIDEAQNLSHSVLEQIRMLSNLETEKEKLVQIVLVGQLELRELLASPALKQLDERIMVRYDLKPLDREDVQGYVEHRLVVAGGRGNVRFTKGALGAIYAYSEGNPRRINGLCDRALLIAYSKDEFTISKRMIQKAIEDIRGDVTPGPSPRSNWVQDRITPLTVFLLLLVIIMAGFGGWSLRKENSAPIAQEPKPTSNQNISLQGKERGGIEAETLPAKQGVQTAKTEKIASIPAKTETKPASLFLSEQASLAGLFRLFDAKGHQDNSTAREVHLGLYLFNTEPELHIMFKKPFWVRVASPARNPVSSHTGVVTSRRYLLIREVTADGAIVIDAEGKERPITKDFIITNWGKEVCWVYPYEDRDVNLARGMSGLKVVKLQHALNEIGYSLQHTGLYDQATFDRVMSFQSDFGLKADGIVGTRTKGLLYQMTDELYP